MRIHADPDPQPCLVVLPHNDIALLLEAGNNAAPVVVVEAKNVHLRLVLHIQQIVEASVSLL